MKKLLLCLTCVAPLWSFAADSSAPDMVQYLNQLQVKLDHAAQRANQPTAGGASVVGLRGAPPSAEASTLYWKGKEKPAKVSAEEFKAFRDAVALARAGKKTDAIAALQSFRAAYPRSALQPDAEETLRRLQ